MSTLPVSSSVLDNKCGSFSLNPWYLIRCKPSQEDRASQNLSNIGAEVLLPMYTAAHSEPRPFFPGYLFSSFPLELFSKVGNAYGVRKIVRFGATLAVVPQEVISDISERMQGGNIEIKQAKFESGDKVMVTAGPWRNFVGVFDCESSRDRVRILLDTVGFANEGLRSAHTCGSFIKLNLSRQEIMLV